MSLVSAAQSVNPTVHITRRSGDFHPSIWGDHFVNYANELKASDDKMEQEAERLKEEVRALLTSVEYSESCIDELVQLIDAIQRLGISYHFDTEISQILGKISIMVSQVGFSHDHLHIASLIFRLLRAEGYNISSDIFKQFTNKEGKFKGELRSDVQGMLSLYEAAHFLVHGEFILDEAISFATSHLENSMNSSDLSSFLKKQIKRALMQPIRKGIPRVEAKHFISIYHEDHSHNIMLLRLAKLDFNILQKLHRTEIAEATRWWNDLDFKSTIPYARDRLVEGYMWGFGAHFEPKYSVGRMIMTKVFAVSTIFDDTYDTYGTLEELDAFTNVVNRWDIKCTDQLPGYMKPIYRALINVYKEFESLMEIEGRESHRIHFAKEMEQRHLQSYFDEAKWFHENHVPTVEEYMEVRIVSSGYYLLMVTVLLGMGDVATKETFEWLSKYPKIARSSSIICRLMDDLVGHKNERERGHAASSIECYVKQHGVTEEEAYNYFRAQIADSWKDINEECLEPREKPMAILMPIVNLTCVMDYLYKKENCYTESGGIMKNTIKSMFVDPIPM